MTSERIATVRPVSEDEATGKVAAVYADIKKVKNIDRIPNFWRVLATNPDNLEMIWTRLKALMHPETVGRTSKLDPLTRELIALAVSATNGCAYCTNSHTAAARKLGCDAETLGEALAVAALFNTTNMLADGYQVAPDVFPPEE
ncbi:MAG: carboxymuconolactone decarboxylase family protein [Acidobacteria bacterium]|nr:carboxymuconolactone decarboxylase family protein [Acidobacteriota bacterium]